MITLKQSTAYTFRIGPFLDETDGFTAETGLTITQPDIRLAKAGGNFAQLAASGTLTHDEAGWYILTLATGDTDTVGSLIVAIHESGALPVWVEYQVLEEATYDLLYAYGATPAIAIADALLKRDMSAVTGESARSPLNAFRAIRNKITIDAGTLSVKKEDDTEEAWSAVVTTAAGDPISEIDPT